MDETVNISDNTSKSGRQALRDWREGRHWTQVRLAEAVGVARSTITQIELGDRSPSFRLAKKLADLTGIPLGNF